jgi:hypothetical protein
VKSRVQGESAIPNHLNRRKKPVPAAGNCLNENGSVRRVPKHFTQTFDGRVQACIEIHKGVCRPKRRMEIFAGDNPAGALQQLPQNEEGLILKPQLRAVSSELTRAGIQLKGAKSIARQSRRRCNL